MKNLDSSSKQTVNVWLPWVYSYKFNVFPFFIYKIMTLEETNTKRNSSGLFFPFTSPYYNIELVVWESTINMSVFTKFMPDIPVSDMP